MAETNAEMEPTPEITSVELMAMLGYGDGPGDECELCDKGTDEQPGRRVRVEVTPFKLAPLSPVTFTEFTGCLPCLTRVAAGDWSAALANPSSRPLVEAYRANWRGLPPGEILATAD